MKKETEDDFGSWAFDPIRPEFGEEVESGEVIIAGKNFGSGSSRETAVTILQAKGIDCIVAESVSRAFFRNCINLGLRVYICPEASKGIQDGDEVRVDHHSGAIQNETAGVTYQAEKHPEFINEILEAGGIEEYHYMLQETDT